MIKTAAIEIMRTMSKSDLIRFEEFIISPYHNKIKNIIKLFSHLKKYHPDFSDKQIEKEFVWSKLFPGKKYNYGTMKNLIHEFGKVCEDYVAVEHSRNNEFVNFYGLAEALCDKGLVKMLSIKLNTLDKLIEGNFLKGNDSRIEEEYFVLANIYSLKMYFQLSNISKGDLKETRNAASEYLLYSFFIYMNKMLCNENISRGRDRDSEKTGLLAQFLSAVGDEGMLLLIDTARKRSPLHFHIMNCYYRMCKCQGFEVRSENYFEFKKALFESDGYIKGRYAFDLSVNLGNALIITKNLGNKCQETLDIYDYRIRNGLLVEPGQSLKGHAFISYIINALVLNKRIAIEKFNTEFLNEVHADEYEICSLVSRACIDHIEGNYGRSIEAVSKCRSDVPVIKIFLKDLKIMNLYEMDDYESLLYEIDSYKHLIRYKNNPAMLKNYNYDFCVSVKKLMEIRNKFDLAELKCVENLKCSFINTSHYWLIGKVKELKKEKMK